MRKYEEEKYRLDKIREKIYPWVKGELVDYQVINGKDISAQDTPLITFVGNLHIVLVINRGNDTYEIIRDKMLPPDCDIEELYHTACANLVRDVEFVVSQTLYGGFGIVADGYHEASSLCFQQIWKMCAEKLKDDLLIMAPAKDTVVFLPLGQKEKLPYMKEYAKQAYERNRDKIGLQIFRFSRTRKELTVYEEN
ncbi:hypothetical protein [Faecalimonas sp.]